MQAETAGPLLSGLRGPPGGAASAARAAGGGVVVAKPPVPLYGTLFMGPHLASDLYAARAGLWYTEIWVRNRWNHGLKEIADGG